MNRFRRRILAAAAASALLREAGPAHAENGAPPAPRALGYLPWWMAAGWKDIAWHWLDRLVLFDAPIEADGSIVDRKWREIAGGLLARAPLASVPVELALSLFEEEHFKAVFGARAARKRLLEAAVASLEHAAISGLHIDVEGFSKASEAATAGFREWLAALDEARRAKKKILSAFFPASDAFTPYDKASAALPDYWVAQIYDAHWAGSETTGPIMTRAPGNPVAIPAALERLAALGVSRERVLLSVPLYGREWPSDSDQPGARSRGEGALLTFAPTPQELMPKDRRVATDLARRYGLRRDGESTPYYAYYDGRHWNQGWYEDYSSLTRKLGPERAAGYAGLAFFALGYDQGRLVHAMLHWWRARRARS